MTSVEKIPHWRRPGKAIAAHYWCVFHIGWPLKCTSHRKYVCSLRILKSSTAYYSWESVRVRWKCTARRSSGNGNCNHCTNANVINEWRIHNIACIKMQEDDDKKGIIWIHYRVQMQRKAFLYTHWYCRHAVSDRPVAAPHYSPFHHKYTHKHSLTQQSNAMQWTLTANATTTAHTNIVHQITPWKLYSHRILNKLIKSIRCCCICSAFAHKATYGTQFISSERAANAEKKKPAKKTAKKRNTNSTNNWLKVRQNIFPLIGTWFSCLVLHFGQYYKCAQVNFSLFFSLLFADASLSVHFAYLLCARWWNPVQYCYVRIVHCIIGFAFGRIVVTCFEPNALAWMHK